MKSSKTLLILLLAPLLAAAMASPATSRHHSKKKRTSALARLRARRTARAFVESSDLRPMAQQLLENRTPAAYAGVERYARGHATQDAGALGWLVVGYAH